MSQYGPQLPPRLQEDLQALKKADEKSDGTEKNSESTETLRAPKEFDEPKESSVKIPLGPSLPPGFSRPPRPEGPSLPPEIANAKRVFGPTFPVPGSIPRNTEEESEIKNGEEFEELVGPSLSLMASETDFSAADAVADRFARQVERLRKANEESAPQRESWMTDLPTELLGRSAIAATPTGPRTFKRRSDDYEADFSGWTSGPNGSKKRNEGEKAKESLETLQNEQALQRERHLEAQIAENNKQKRGEALVTLVHQQAKPQVSGERRPFDRERDLNIKKVIKMDKEGVMQRAAELKEKFASSGKAGQKFL